MKLQAAYDKAAVHPTLCRLKGTAGQKNGFPYMIFRIIESPILCARQLCIHCPTVNGQLPTSVHAGYQFRRDVNSIKEPSLSAYSGHGRPPFDLSSMPRDRSNTEGRC